MNPVTRRAALSAMVATAAAGLAPRLAGAQAQPIVPGALEAMIDVLLPGLEGAPPASELGITATLLADTPPGSLSERLLAAGTQVLDSVGPVPFAALPAAAQVEVVDWLAASDYDEIPGRFYHVTRLFAVGLYFSYPEACAGLPLNVAPQPAGYPPPWGSP